MGVYLQAYVLGVVGTILGVMGRKNDTGRTMATAGMILSIIGIAIGCNLFYLLFYILYHLCFLPLLLVLTDSYHVLNRLNHSVCSCFFQ